MATIGVAAVIAAIVAAIVAAAWTLKFIALRFAASARSDIATHKLSLTTVGYGAPLAWVAAWLVASLSGTRAGGGLPALLWFVQDVLFLATFIAVATWAPVRAGEVARPTVEHRRPAPTFWRWAAGAAVSFWFTLLLFSEIGRRGTDPGMQLILLVFVVGIAAVQIAGLAWGWSGRPDWLTPARDRGRRWLDQRTTASQSDSAAARWNPEAMTAASPTEPGGPEEP